MRETDAGSLVGGVRGSLLSCERDERKEPGGWSERELWRGVCRSTCFAIAAPCLCTLPLAVAAEAHVTTVVAGKDVVCRLSIANVQHLVTKLNAASPATGVLRLVQQVLGSSSDSDGGDRRQHASVAEAELSSTAEQPEGDAPSSSRSRSKPEAEQGEHRVAWSVTLSQ